MRSTSRDITVTLCVLGLTGLALSSCGPADDDGSVGNAGTGGVNSGGTVAMGGTSSSAGALSNGGTTSAGGASSVAGTMNSGGSAAVAGMAGVSGSASAGGSGGNAGSAGQGGASGGSAGTPATGGSAGTGGGAGGCIKGQTKGNEVAMIGESFIAFSHGITKTIETLAKAAGSLAQNEKYVDESVSGTLLSGNDPNAIPRQYARAQDENPIKYVLMDGGGNDCMGGGDGEAALAAAKTLFQTMATDEVEKVQYFFYPDPIGNQYSNLKSCLDVLRPKMKALCDGLTSPKCYWLDLRPTWNGHNEYTSDGIHPTPAGDTATGNAIWAEMVKNCVAQ